MVRINKRSLRGFSNFLRIRNVSKHTKMHMIQKAIFFFLFYGPNLV